MLKFNQVPPTAETIDIDPQAIRMLAYGVEDRCIDSVAEVCASMVLANSTDVDEVRAIGEKIGDAIKESPASKYPQGDSAAFVLRYQSVVSVLGARMIST